MGYLDKATITVDAILTNRGRELLAEGGSNSLDIKYFAVADDEIDYGLYYVGHPDGDMGIIIENMPILEATPDEQQIMRYKLASFNEENLVTDGVLTVPQISNNVADSYTITLPTETKTIGISTSGLPTTVTETYTLLIADATLFNVYKGTAPNTLVNTDSTINANGSITISNIDGGSSAIIIKPKTVGSVPNASITKTGTTVATIFGEQTGATKSFTVTITRS